MRALICSAIGIVVVLVMLALTPAPVHTPKGIFLPADTKARAPISPAKVVIYHQEPFGNFQTLGQIRTEVAFQNPRSKSRKELMQYVKKLAASKGGNGIVVRVLVPDDGVQQAYTFIGDVIHLGTVTQ